MEEEFNEAMFEEEELRALLSAAALILHAEEYADFQMGRKEMIALHYAKNKVMDILDEEEH